MISRQSDEVPVDFLLLREDLSRQRVDIKVQILAKKLAIRELRVLLYPFHMLRQLYHISTSKVVLLDGYCIVASVAKHKPQTKLIQIWHATAAIKKFGWQIVGKPSGASITTATIMRMHDQYDIVLAPSQTTGEVYQEAFNIDADKIRYFGLPHLSVLTEPQNEILDEIRSMFAIDPGKKTILYVPTFREGKCVNLQGLIDEIDFEKYELVAKVHPLDKLPPHDDRVIYAERYTTTAWMQLADFIITDYSSLLVEAAILNKPLYLYVYDLEEYSGDPGLNLDYTEPSIAPIVFRDAPGLAVEMGCPYDFAVLEYIRDQFIQIDVKNCRNALVNLITGVFDGHPEGF